MSTVPPTMRGKPGPRWSVARGSPVLGSTARALLPALMAGLPASRAMVWVGPPLSARVPRPGLATPTWLPLVPLARPPEPPVPIRLYALAEDTEPAMSSAGAPLPVPLVFRATMVLSRVTRAGDDIQPAARATAGDVVVGDGAVDRR